MFLSLFPECNVSWVAKRPQIYLVVDNQSGTISRTNLPCKVEIRHLVAKRTIMALLRVVQRSNEEARMLSHLPSSKESQTKMGQLQILKYNASLMTNAMGLLKKELEIKAVL